MMPSTSILDERYKIALHALSKYVFYKYNIDHQDRVKYLKTREGAFQHFMRCLLNQMIDKNRLEQIMKRVEEEGLLDYDKLVFEMKRDPKSLENRLRKVLKSHRFPTKLSRAIVNNVKILETEYMGNIHNIYEQALKEYPEDKSKQVKKIWSALKNFDRVGSKVAGMFFRDMVRFEKEKVWDLPIEALTDIPIPIDVRVRRVLHKLKYVENPNNTREVRRAGKRLAEEVGLIPLILDEGLYAIGHKEICGERKTHCEFCPLGRLGCPSSTTLSKND